jgi:hypothetical protein
MFLQVENKGRYKTAQPFYWYARDKDIDYLFTESALDEAAKRADKNPEDIPRFPNVVDKDNSNYFVGFVTGMLVGAFLVVATYFTLQGLGITG